MTHSTQNNNYYTHSRQKHASVHVHCKNADNQTQWGVFLPCITRLYWNIPNFNSINSTTLAYKNHLLITFTVFCKDKKE